MASAALKAASFEGGGWAPSGAASSWECQACLGEAQEPSWGAAKTALWPRCRAVVANARHERAVVKTELLHAALGVVGDVEELTVAGHALAGNHLAGRAAVVADCVLLLTIPREDLQPAVQPVGDAKVAVRQRDHGGARGRSSCSWSVIAEAAHSRRQVPNSSFNILELFGGRYSGGLPPEYMYFQRTTRHGLQKKSQLANYLLSRTWAFSLKPRSSALDATGMLVTLLFLVSLPFGRALVARQSTRPDLTPVLRLKGGAGFNQWIRLFRVVVKGAKGGARSAQRGPAARGTAARGAAMEQGAGFSRLLSVPSSGELAATPMASRSLAGGSSGSTTMAATALAVRPPAVGGPAATPIGAARGSSALSTRSLSAARPQFPAPTLSGVEPCRGVEPCIDLPRSEPPRQRDSTASRYSTRYSTPYYTRYTRYTRYSSTGAAALALAPGAAAGAAPGAAAGATAGAAPGVAAGAPATTVLLEVAMCSGALGLGFLTLTLTLTLTFHPNFNPNFNPNPNQVAMWSGAWGLLDAVVDLLAPEDTGALYLLTMATY